MSVLLRILNRVFILSNIFRNKHNHDFDESPQKLSAPKDAPQGVIKGYSKKMWLVNVGREF